MSFMQKFVRNEAARNDPPEVYNGRALAISLIVRTQHARILHSNETNTLQACGGALLFGMDMGIIGGVLVMRTFEEYVMNCDYPRS